MNGNMQHKKSLTLSKARRPSARGVIETLPKQLRGRSDYSTHHESWSLCDAGFVQGKLRLHEVVLLTTDALCPG